LTGDIRGGVTAMDKWRSPREARHNLLRDSMIQDSLVERIERRCEN